MNLNKYHPLPSDYGSLTEDGQRLARLHVLRDQSTPTKLVEAWALFRNLYLRPRGEAFYSGGFKPSPKFHYQMVEDLGTYARNAQAAPRGFGKSIVMGIEVPILLLLTRPNFSITLAMATDRLIEERFGKIMMELEENPQILNDFGAMKPTRGSAKTWNHHYLHLLNGAILQGFSVMGRKRGARPRLFLMDDPEFDSDSTGGAASSQYVITEKYEQILFRQIIPMLAKGSAMFWIGTMINRRCLLYKICEDDDPRFKVWMRRVYVAENKDHTRQLWPSAWPAEFLRAREAEMGSSAFSTEYLNRPLTDETKLLNINPTFNEYSIDGYNTLPSAETQFLLTSNLKVRWNERVRVKGPNDELNFETIQKEGEAKKVFGSMYRVMTVDTASGLTSQNDFRAIAVMGYDHSNCLWILDMWLGRIKDSQFYPIIYRMGRSWLVRAIGIEAFSTQGSLVDSMSEYVEDFTEKLSAASMQDSIWTPRVVPVKPPLRIPKGDRIAELEWRFQSGKIKYPSHRKMSWPFSALYEQTENFTRDLALLRFDDAIDCVALSNYLVHAKGHATVQEATKKTLVERIRHEEPVVPGIPLLSGVRPSSLSQEEIDALLANFIERQYTIANHETRGKPTIIG